MIIIEFSIKSITSKYSSFQLLVFFSFLSFMLVAVPPLPPRFHCHSLKKCIICNNETGYNNGTQFAIRFLLKTTCSTNWCAHHFQIYLISTTQFSNNAIRWHRVNRHPQNWHFIEYFQLKFSFSSAMIESFGPWLKHRAVARTSMN